MNVTQKQQKGPAIGDRTFDVINFILLTLFFLLCLYPLLFVISASFSSATAVSTGQVRIWPVGFNIEAYRAVFFSNNVWTGYRNSIIYTISTVVLNLVISVFAAYPLSRKDMPFNRIVMFLFVFTMYFGGGMIPFFMLIQQLGWMDNPLAIIVPAGVSVFHIILIRTYFQSSIPGEIREAAEIDGCSDFRYLFTMAIPLAKPVLAVIVMYAAVSSWNSFFSAMLFLRSRELYPLQLVLRNILIMNEINAEALIMGFADPNAIEQIFALQTLMQFALIVVACIPMMLLYPVVQRHFTQGITLGAVKG